MKATIDRIENNQVILELPDSRYIACDRALFPADISDGDILNISITIENSARQKREQEIKSLQKKLQNNQ